jgi:hypothetical protein
VAQKRTIIATSAFKRGKMIWLRPGWRFAVRYIEQAARFTRTDRTKDSLLASPSIQFSVSLTARHLLLRLEARILTMGRVGG